MKSFLSLGLALVLSLPFAACTRDQAKPRPVITGLSPTRGAADTTVYITGTNLAGVTHVRFGGAWVGCLSDGSADRLRVSVPSRVQPDTVAVVAVGPGGASNSLPFRVTATPPPAELLTRRPWHLTAEYSYNPDGDLYRLRPACAQDDILRFELPNRVTLDEGPTTCAAADPQTYVGTWTLTKVPGIYSPLLTLTGIPGFPTAPIPINTLLSAEQLGLFYPDSSRGPDYRISRLYSNR